jgi:hypothetical protein
VRAEVKAVARGAPDSEQCLSGASPDCLVPLEYKAPMVDSARTLTIGWRGWRTGLSGAPIDSSPTPTVVWWLRAINTPQPPPLQPSKHSSHFIQYKSKVQHSKTQIKATDPIKVLNSILVLYDLWKDRSCVSLLLLLLGWLSSFSHSHYQSLVSEARDTNRVVVLAGSKWPENQGKKLTRSRWPFER